MDQVYYLYLLFSRLFNDISDGYTLIFLFFFYFLGGLDLALFYFLTSLKWLNRLLNALFIYLNLFPYNGQFILSDNIFLSLLPIHHFLLTFLLHIFRSSLSHSPSTLTHIRSIRSRSCALVDLADRFGRVDYLFMVYLGTENTHVFLLWTELTLTRILTHIYLYRTVFIKI